MSDQSTTPQPTTSRGLIATPLTWLGHIVATLLMALFLRILIEWLGIAFFWPEQGAEHARALMHSELMWYSGNVIHSILMADPVGHLEQALSQVWQWLFVDTGMSAWWQQEHYRVLADTTSWHHGLNTYIQATAWTIMTFILRLFLLLLTAPLFVLTTLVGIVDGLVRRDIRRFGSGYESAFIYHHARRTVRPVLFLPWLIYLSLPFSLHPGVILLPAALLLGLSVSVTVGSFKKYL